MRYAVMSRPCTDWPITRVSVTNEDGGRRGEVDGRWWRLLSSTAVDVVVSCVSAGGSWSVDVVVAGAVVGVVADEAVSTESATSTSTTTSCQITSGATHHDSFIMRCGIRLGVMRTPRSPYGILLRFTNPPTLARNLVIVHMTPYLALILGADPSSCGPVTSTAVAS